MHLLCSHSEAKLHTTHRKPSYLFEIEEILDVFTIIFTYHIRLHFIRKTRSVVRQISGTQVTEEAVRESGKLDLVLAAKTRSTFLKDS